MGQKGVEGMAWLVKDLHEELKSWGRTGGTAGNIVIKTDGEASIVALRDAVAMYHVGIVAPEPPPRERARPMVQPRTTDDGCAV